jgi:hypothetical protein
MVKVSTLPMPARLAAVMRPFARDADLAFAAFGDFAVVERAMITSHAQYAYRL